MQDLLELIWKTDGALTDDAIIRTVVRPEVALGSVTLGMPVGEVFGAIERGPTNERGYRLQIGDEHRVEVGTASDTVAHHLYNEDRNTWRLAWLEWAADQRTNQLVVARFVVGVTSRAPSGGVLGLLAGLRGALDAALGPGVERRSKHRRAVCRPVDWVKGTATLTLGAGYMTSDRWDDYTAIVLEAFDASWPDPTARWRMFR